jgi:type 1 glutamine amidotransferase
MRLVHRLGIRPGTYPGGLAFANDELYRCLVDGRPVQLLATARSKITGKDYPMAFAFEYGKGRVFHTPLGHDVRAIESPGTAELLRRSCLWAGGLKP